MGTQTLPAARLSRFNAEGAGKNGQLPVSPRKGFACILSRSLPRDAASDPPAYMSLLG